MNSVAFTLLIVYYKVRSNNLIMRNKKWFRDYIRWKYFLIPIGTRNRFNSIIRSSSIRKTKRKDRGGWLMISLETSNVQSTIVGNYMDLKVVLISISNLNILSIIIRSSHNQVPVKIKTRTKLIRFDLYILTLIIMFTVHSVLTNCIYICL